MVGGEAGAGWCGGGSDDEAAVRGQAGDSVGLGDDLSRENRDFGWTARSTVTVG